MVSTARCGIASSLICFQSLKAFAPELLTRIFLQLSYKSILRVEAVCVEWKAIVSKHPELKVQMFKKLSKEFVEPGARSPCIGGYATELLTSPKRLQQTFFPVRIQRALCG
jgi:hypothetical protein